MKNKDLLNSKEILFFDGGVGTILMEKNKGFKGLPCILNITDSRCVIDIHKDYIESSANFITTNTFLANRLMLESSNYGVKEVISMAIKNAKVAIEESKSKECYIAQSISMGGKFLNLNEEYTYEMAYDIFKEQVLIGDKEDVDVFLLETFMDIKELEACILACQKNSHKPVFAMMTFRKNGKTYFDVTPKTLGELGTKYNIEAIGVNCTYGAVLIKEIIRDIKKYYSGKIIILPNRGIPEKIKGKTIYKITEEEFFKEVVEISKVGVNYIGGCCGTTPSFIRTLVDGKGKFY